MLFARIISMTVSFIVTTLIARHLGPSNYGQLSYAISFVGIFSFISTLGIDSVLYRELIKHKDQRHIYMGTALALKIAAGFLAALITISAGYLSGARDITFLLIFILSLTFIFNSFNILVYEFQANVESKIPSIIAIIVTLVLSGLKIAVVLSNKGVLYLAGILLLEAFLYSILYIYFRIRKYGTLADWIYDKKVAYSILRDSWPMMFSVAFALVYARIDQVFIKSLINIESVGLYDAAVRVSEVWYFIPNIIMSALFPAIVNAKITDESVYFKRLKYLLVGMTLICIAIAFPITLYSKQIILIIFGPAFIASFTVLQIYIWSLIGTSVNHVLSHFLITENYRRMIFTSSLVGMITNVVLNIWLIPIYGIEGAALATLVSYTLGPISLLTYKQFRKKIVLMFS